MCIYTAGSAGREEFIFNFMILLLSLSYWLSCAFTNAKPGNNFLGKYFVFYVVSLGKNLFQIKEEKEDPSLKKR